MKCIYRMHYVYVVVVLRSVNPDYTSSGLTRDTFKSMGVQKRYNMFTTHSVKYAYLSGFILYNTGYTFPAGLKLIYCKHKHARNKTIPLDYGMVRTCVLDNVCILYFLVNLLCACYR